MITADELKQLWTFGLPYSRSSCLLADVFYRRVTVPPLSMLGLPSGGVLALLLASFVFLTALVFAARPFYRPHLGYGSPPLAIRSGLLIFAYIPLFITSTSKANLVTMLKGISHEKLNVLHRWVAYFSFGLSIAHTIPIFVASYQDRGYARVKSEFYAKGVVGKNEVSGSYPRPSTYKTHCVVQRRPTTCHSLHHMRPLVSSVSQTVLRIILLHSRSHGYHLHWSPVLARRQRTR